MASDSGYKTRKFRASKTAAFSLDGRRLATANANANGTGYRLDVP